MQKFGLIGYPLSHSFSPQYFADKFQQEGITGCTYNAYPIANINELPQLLASNPDLQGLNITIPYKQQILSYLDEQSEAVQKIKACNCTKINNGRLIGYNTDAIGFEKSFQPHLKPHHQKALILGNGGSAAAVKYTLEMLQIEYVVVSRTPPKNLTSMSYGQLSGEVMQEHTIIINTTPLGMYSQVEECPNLPYQYISKDHYCYDLIYNPQQTKFLRNAADKGAFVKNGTEMLVLQAEESWRIWNNQPSAI